jgi:3-methylcrotonyl-CoA carboxylase alpha subunit
MFRKILIANRGEIACRVIATARRLGIASVAVYSEADRQARHVELADEAFLLGPAPAAESYLRGERIIDICRLAGAEAVHPGYGFLSENAEFAEALEAAGLTFIGPPATAIRAMGAKDAAKRMMEEAGVPVVPGYHGKRQDEKTLVKEAKAIGYPVLIKAVAGGGGKGMRLVGAAADLSEALSAARREAKAAFGDERVLIEKYLETPRHIEIQVFADSQGDAVHLFERDCSLQRRHQKVVEEAPAPGMSEDMRARMGDAAVAAAQTINYRGAGTVEFIADVADGLAPDRFYFMEMNTRLQVEHPVTEMITGLDLVEWQLRVAAGEALPLRQDEIVAQGHAIEARVYAEDPDKGFLPATGRVDHLRLPAEGAGLRIDRGLDRGERITPYYDPMIAKVIAWGADRATALARLSAGLEAFELEGCITNVSFLGRLIGHPAFRAQELDTGFIDRHMAELIGGGEAPEEALAVAALHQLLPDRGDQQCAEPDSPWASCHGWRLWGGARQFVHISAPGGAVDVAASFRRGGVIELELPSGLRPVRLLDRQGSQLTLDLGDRVLKASVVGKAGQVTVFLKGATYRFGLPDQLAGEAEAAVADDRLVAPLPGRVSSLKVKAGTRVTKGAPLVVVEAMKMEHTLVAPRDGLVEKVACAEGDQVEEGAALVVLAASDDAESTL